MDQWFKYKTPKTMKPLEENKGEMFWDICLDKDFLGMTPTSQATNARIVKLQTKMLSTASEIVKRT
jgi:hypothetical protein